jgi:hypothetical protein
MAIDVQVTLPLPRWTEQNTRLELKKILTLPVVPRVTDEVFMPGGAYLQVSRVRFREDGHVAVFFDDPWALQGLDGGTIDDVIDTLEAAGYAAQR